MVAQSVRFASSPLLSIVYPLRFGIRPNRVIIIDPISNQTTAMLSQRQYDALWNGNLRYVPAVVAAVLFMSIITLSLSAVYGVQLARAPLDPHEIENHGAHRWSNA